MSGGVDSSVTAALLLEMGYEVVGITMKIWPEGGNDKLREGGCCSLSAVDDARQVANKLGIPYYVLNFQDIFKEKVINYFVDEYTHGRTPNPCIACNKFVKFEALLKKAISFEADYVATGHYAKIGLDESSGRYLIRKSDTAAKDQTYALYNLNQDQLKHILMPLGYYQSKDKVREIADRLGLAVANKPDSQEICFVDDNNYARFIEENTEYKSKPGNFVDVKGTILGKHKGIIHYTVGQRKGLGIAFGKPMFVVGIDAKLNTVILGEDKQIYKDELTAHTVNFIPFDDLSEPMKVTAKIRYAAKDSPAEITSLPNNRARVKFDEPQRAITPGQAVVFYDGDILVGGGTIE